MPQNMGDPKSRQWFMEETEAGWPEKQMRSFLAALRFLTIIPIVRGAEFDGDYFKQSLLYFPAIGVVIGTICMVLATAAQFFLPQPIVACVVIVFLAFISGCLHLDGLSDSGDGLLSSRPRGRSMEIMKDSRVGAMGVIVTVLVLLTKYSALVSMDARLVPMASFYMPFTGRVIILCTMALLPYARTEGGLGTLFYSSSVRKFALVGAVALITFLLIFSAQRFFIIITLVVLSFVSFNIWCKSKIGGATGDTLGANCELAEMVVAVAFSVSLSVTL